MHRFFAVASRTFLIAALVILALPAAAQTITVTETSVTIDGREIQLPATESDVMNAIQGSPVAHLELADEYSDRVFHWLNLGIVAFSNPRTMRVHGFELLLSKPPYWQGLLFQGHVVIGGNRIDGDTTLAQVAAFGFTLNGSWAWRRGCAYVSVSSEDGEHLSTIEIGRRQDNSVLPPLLQSATPCSGGKGDVPVINPAGTN